METSQKGLALLIFIGVASILLFLVGYTYLTFTEEDMFACPEETKRCADGTFVMRTGPFCNFPKCAPGKPTPSQKQSAIDVAPLCGDALGQLNQSNPGAYEAVVADYAKIVDANKQCSEIGDSGLHVGFFDIATGAQMMFVLAAMDGAPVEFAVYQQENNAFAKLSNEQLTGDLSFNTAYTEEETLVVVSPIASGGTRFAYYKMINGQLKIDRITFDYGQAM